MIRIAICDDDAAMRTRIEQSVKNILIEKHIVYKLQLFDAGDFLMYEIQEGAHFDLMLLDIEMPGIDGISLANKIREKLSSCAVIFITSHSQYVYDSFKVSPFRYIPKQCFEEKIDEAVSSAIVWIEENIHRYYTAENGKGIELIPIGDINHIWHYDKYSFIERKNGENVKVRKTLKKIFSELPEGDFIWLDKGCICNLGQISKVNGSDVVLLSGRVLNVSRDRVSEVKAYLRDYWSIDEDKKA